KFSLSHHFFFFQAEDGIRDRNVTGVQTCALPIFASLSPRMTIEQIVGEGVALHMPELSRDERRQRILSMLAEVGLSEAAGITDRSEERRVGRGGRGRRGRGACRGREERASDGRVL